VEYSSKRPIGVLVFANKQDLPHAKSAFEVAKLLKLDEPFIKKAGYYWHVLPTSMYDPPTEEEIDADPWRRRYTKRPDTVHYSQCQEVLDLFAAKQYRKLFEKFGGVTSLNFETLLAEEAKAEKLKDSTRHGDQSMWAMDQTMRTRDLDLSVSAAAATGGGEENSNRKVEAETEKAPTTIPTPSAVVVDDQLLEHERKKRELIWQEWLSRAAVLPLSADNDIEVIDSDEHFIAALKNCTLTSWDHLTHIRIAWIFIRRYGLQQGFTAIEESIAHYIQHGGRTDGKSFHPTMTRFWCHMVAYWLIHWSCDNDDKKAGSTHPFHQFLQYVHEERDFQDTDIANGALFKVYFSPGLIFSPSAKSAIVRPDLKNLVDFTGTHSLLSSSSVLKKEQAFLKTHDYWRLFSSDEK
jgi:hypothetical protein